MAFVGGTYVARIIFVMTLEPKIHKSKRKHQNRFETE